MKQQLRSDTVITGSLEVQTFIKLLAGAGYIDLAQNEIRNVVVQVLATEPSTPSAGQIIYNSARSAGSRLGYYNGTAWIYMNADADTLDGQHGSYYQARANHTGTQVAATISDFSEAVQDAVNSALIDTYSIDFTYDDTNNQIKADVKLVSGGGLEAVSGGVQLTNLVTAGTSTKITYDAKGRVTAGSALLSTDLPEHDSLHTKMTLNQFALPTADISMNSRKITSLADPISGTDAATKNYVDNLTQGLDAKNSVKLATTGNISLSGVGVSIDGISYSAGERILVKDQTNKTENGIYTAASGSWVRATDSDSWNELISAYVWVEQGTVNGDTGWLCTVDAGGTLGSTNVTWVQFTGAGQITAGNGLTKTGNTLDVNVDGTSIVIEADTLKVASNYLNPKKTGSFTGDGTTKSFTLTHNLNSQNVIPTIRQAADNQIVIVPFAATTVNALTVEFNPAPANNEVFNWVVI